MSRDWKAGLLGGLMALVIMASPALAQTRATQAAPQEGPGRGRANAGRAAGARAAVPPVRPGMTAQQLQNHMDAVALQQAQEQLKLTDEQYPTFAVKLTKLQNIRRRTSNDRRRLLMELRVLLDASPAAKDDVIAEKLRALEDVNRRGADELVKSYQEIDTTLTPWQRARFRLFEEQLERRKVELLARIGAGK